MKHYKEINYLALTDLREAFTIKGAMEALRAFPVDQRGKYTSVRIRIPTTRELGGKMRIDPRTVMVEGKHGWESKWMWECEKVLYDLHGMVRE